MKGKIIATLLACLLLSNTALGAGLEVKAPSAILMDVTTGQVLFEQEPDTVLRPASVTKVMTLLLVMEALERGQLSWDDTITTSAAAASKGGSQIYLEEGEALSIDEMLKSVVVSSANDCATALAEAVAGSEAAFVEKMNARAKELSMNNTNFVNCTGLDDGEEGAQHLTTARDIAIMSRELLHHEKIKDYTTIWMDTVRDGQFGLSNTNKLIRFYDGATGLKTGYTSAAGHCLSASAQRDGMELVAVVLNCASSADRFTSATAMLDYGFANYGLAYPTLEEPLTPVQVTLGTTKTILPVLADETGVLVDKAKIAQVTTEVQLAETVEAPVNQGQILGTVTMKAGDETLKTVDLVAPDQVAHLTWFQVMAEMLRCLAMIAD